MNIEKEIKEKQALLLLISKSKYSSKLTDLMNVLDKNFKKIGYVNLNKSYKKLKDDLTKTKINHKKFFVIGLNKPPKSQGETENYRHIGSAANFGELNIEFSSLVYMGCGVFLFDSLSDMTAKVKKNELLKFVHTIIVKAKIANTKVIFLAINENIDFYAFKELRMVFDKVINDTIK